MSERDDELESRKRYRELPREEPPGRLDEAIRARARDKPRSGRRWYVPAAAAAAALGLAVGIALQVERKPAHPVVASAPSPQEAPARRDEGKERKAESFARDSAESARAPAAASAQQGALSPGNAETPQQWLERIVRLRAEGRHEEADKALADFRRRHPDFRIAPETLEKVERR